MGASILPLLLLCVMFLLLFLLRTADVVVFVLVDGVSIVAAAVVMYVPLVVATDALLDRVYLPALLSVWVYYTQLR